MEGRSWHDGWVSRVIATPVVQICPDHIPTELANATQMLAVQKIDCRKAWWLSLTNWDSWLEEGSNTSSINKDFLWICDCPADGLKLPAYRKPLLTVVASYSGSVRKTYLASQTANKVVWYWYRAFAPCSSRVWYSCSCSLLTSIKG